MIKDQEREIGCVVNSVGRPVCFDRRSLTTLVPHKKRKKKKWNYANGCVHGHVSWAERRAASSVGRSDVAFR